MPVSSLIARLPYPSASTQRALAIAAIITQGGIGVTGSVVRVTGSGLGCPTWPQCFEGSMFPVEHPEYDTLNQWIEFGNRLLTGVVVLVAALCVLAAWRIYLTHPGRKRLLVLAWTMPGGVVAQAAIGGLTVLTGLLWWTVAIHFLASTILVWLAVMLLHAFAEGDEPPRWQISAGGRKLLVALVVALAGVLIAGTTVTGAGPHGGDPDTPRLQAPIEALATVHGALLVIYLAVLAALGLHLLRGGATRRLWRRYGIVWAVALAQGGLGTLQYELGVPEALVSFHVLGSAVVIVATAALWCAARDRGPSVSFHAAPSVAQDISSTDRRKPTVTRS
ncbi:cytochrome c oxidase assembly protein subunit 15 [Amycolatopsis marina]|uniref:Cytochrome c oxidase assembly protein subunit 15 n=1 Tax=Amycolatopsis marina TaxID=490629 RepID=A0A1I0Z735_9PSEU|nr:COX15/CtaA family protein [Amycolatopsis marina]SFB21157.1 cytochrome c oxidase assembly protein subunit 15 [Amycolatopsis marina]